MIPSQPPSLGERLLVACMYLCVAGIGVSVIVWPPFDSVTNSMGAISATVWALFILSSAAAVPASLSGKYLVEYVLLPFFGTALAVADAAVWFELFVGRGDSAMFARVCAGSALFFALWHRWHVLHRLTKVSKQVREGRRSWTSQH